MTAPLDVSVVIPTIGRPELVRACLASLARCLPGAAEALIVDSSADDAVREVVATFPTARSIRCGPGLGAAFNLGLREASHDIVLLTNDDCTLDEAWVATGRDRLLDDPGTIVTGRVRPAGDPDVVPSTIDDAERREHVRPNFVLFTQCMALDRRQVLAFGGFDERIRHGADDNDLSYRWLRAGRRIRYEPDFVAWHHDWRTPEELDRLYVTYGLGQGMVYGKFLRARDPYILRFVARDAYAIARGLVDRVVRGRRPYGDWRLGLAHGLPVGMVRGWRAFGGSNR